MRWLHLVPLTLVSIAACVDSTAPPTSPPPPVPEPVIRAEIVGPGCVDRADWYRFRASVEPWDAEVTMSWVRADSVRQESVGEDRILSLWFDAGSYDTELRLGVLGADGGRAQAAKTVRVRAPVATATTTAGVQAAMTLPPACDSADDLRLHLR
jgi:hypothetical protein